MVRTRAVLTLLLALLSPGKADAFQHRESGSVWEITLESDEIDRIDSADIRRELARLAAPGVSKALEDGLDVLELMDDLGDNQGIHVTGIGTQTPVLVSPKGKTAYENVLALQEAAGGTLYIGWDGIRPIADDLPLEMQEPYLAALEAVLPGRLERRENFLYGKVVSFACQHGPFERFHLLLLDDGEVALQSHAGFFAYDPNLEQQLRADAPDLSFDARWRLHRHDFGTVSFESSGRTFLHWGERLFFEVDALSPEIVTNRRPAHAQQGAFLREGQ